MQSDQYCLKNENQSKINLDKEIEEFIKEYRSFLLNNHIDVAKSTIDNTWFVYRYKKEYGYYEYFIRFSTVSQLVDIILDEMKVFGANRRFELEENKFYNQFHNHKNKITSVLCSK